jgi:hypothetical protein
MFGATVLLTMTVLRVLLPLALVLWLGSLLNRPNKTAV